MVGECEAQKVGRNVSFGASRIRERILWGFTLRAATASGLRMPVTDVTSPTARIAGLSSVCIYASVFVRRDWVNRCSDDQ